MAHKSQLQHQHLELTLHHLMLSECTARFLDRGDGLLNKIGRLFRSRTRGFLSPYFLINSFKQVSQGARPTNKSFPHTLRPNRRENPVSRSATSQNVFRR